MRLARQLLAQARSPRRRLQLATALAGGAFAWSVTRAPAFAFARLPTRVFAATGFRERRGFFHVLRWLEQLDAPDDLAAFLQAVAAFHAAPVASDEPSPAFRSAQELLAHARDCAQWETYVLVSKTALQWGLLVFLSRAKALTTRVAVPCVCLGILALLCAKIAQSSVLEILASASSVAPAKQRDRAAFMAAFLGMLFVVRGVATALVSAAIARAYQAFFGGWPPPRWKDVPRYIGSKNFALSTLFYGVASVSVMAVSSGALRSLSEAAYHIESLALIAAFGHFVVHELGLSAEISPITGPQSKPKQS